MSKKSFLFLQNVIGKQCSKFGEHLSKTVDTFLSTDGHQTLGCRCGWFYTQCKWMTTEDNNDINKPSSEEKTRRRFFSDEMQQQLEANEVEQTKQLPYQFHPSINKQCSLRTSSALASTRKPCCRKETAQCRSCSFRFKVCQQHSLQV